MTVSTSEIRRGGVHPGYVWRCRKCGKGEAEGGVPRFKRSPLRPEAWCEGCYRAHNRLLMHNKRRKARGEKPVAVLGEIAPPGARRLWALSRRWYKYAQSDLARATEIERRDPEMAARLRDRAQDWRALARQAVRGTIE